MDVMIKNQKLSKYYLVPFDLYASLCLVDTCFVILNYIVKLVFPLVVILLLINLGKIDHQC